MENGQEANVGLELTESEHQWLRTIHTGHVKCAFDNCYIHVLIHMVVRVEAARRRMEHELVATAENEMGTHGEGGTCEKCRWTSVDWIKTLSAEWREGSGG